MKSLKESLSKSLFESNLIALGFTKSTDLESLKVTYEIKNDLRFFLEDDELVGLHISGAKWTNTRWSTFPVFSFEKLKVLYLADNDFRNFSNEDNVFPNLEFFEISNNRNLKKIKLKITHYIKEIRASYCKNLDTVIIEGEGLNLEKIDLSTCKISEIKLPSILPKLTLLDISNNPLISIQSFKDLNSLEYLNLSNNLLSNFDIRAKSPKLSILDLSGNIILNRLSTQLLSAKESLESVNLSHTEIDREELQIFADFKNLKRVDLDNTTFEKKYPELTALGWEAIKTLFSNEQIEFLHVKVLLLGNTNIGKSNLLYYWENRGHDIEASKSTHGIVYKEISNLFKTQLGKEIILHIWDFGGQEYFHATHKLFFSGGAINILLWSPENSLREEQEDRCFELEYWLRCIEQLGYDGSGSLKSETLVVENKIDNRNYLATPVNQEKYQNKFGEKIDFHYHSMALMPEGKSTNQPRRLTGLNDLLFERIQNKNFSRDISYENTYNRIKKLKEPIIEVKKLFSANPTEEEITLLRVFHNMGILLYFHEILPDLVFIKPASFLQFLYTDLFGKDKSHKITEAGIKKVLEASSFNTLLTQEKLIDILKSFDLIFKINENQTTFFIPQYLPPKPIWLDFFEEHHFRFPTVLIESDSYLMNLVMLKIFGEYGKSVKREGNEYLFWNDGIVIEQEFRGKKNILLIKFDRENQRIELYEDEENFDLLKSVIDFVVSIPEKLKRSLKDNSGASTNDEIEASVLSESNKRTHTPWETPYFDIRLTTDGQYYVYYRELVEAKKALNNFVRSFDKTKIEEFYKPILVYKFNKYLPKNQQSEMKKLMISYSKKDLYLIEEFKKYLEPLIRDGIIDEPWYCTMLEAGQEWDSEIQDRLKNWCDIICFMCSPNSFSADYIKEKEIKVAIDRFELKNDIMIVPIILEPFRWISNNEKYNLGRFTALPYTAKPVTDFKQRNMAWYIIEECLRVAILNNLKPEGEDYWADTEKAKLPKDVISYFERIVRGGLDI